MTDYDPIAEELAYALLDGPADKSAFAERVAAALGQDHKWIKPFTHRVFKKFGEKLTYAQRDELILFIKKDGGYRAALLTRNKLRIRKYFIPAPEMGHPPAALKIEALPAFATSHDLALWLGLSHEELDWFADTRKMIHAGEGPLCHYNYKWIAKRYGYRLLESPKERLRHIQRKILRGILNHIPPHPAAHGFRRDHSCVSYATPHVGQKILIHMDLRDFFISIPSRRINALFRTLGYPASPAKYLTGLCTNALPRRTKLPKPSSNSGYELSHAEYAKLLEDHLPQGAPTSPALANLCALYFDYRVSALAEKSGATYTRYADDIAFSGGEELRRSAQHSINLITQIAKEEGFSINFRKTRIMHASDRQILTGIVVNEKINMERRTFEALKAMLYNCARHGPETQNREEHPDFHAHLLGQISYMRNLHPVRGQKLKEIFDLINWD